MSASCCSGLCDLVAERLVDLGLLNVIVMPKRFYRGKRGRKELGKNVVTVDRPGRWGNPFFLAKAKIPWFTIELAALRGLRLASFRCASRQECVDKFEEALYAGLLLIKPIDIYENLRGKDLACFDRDNHPSHADVLLEIANGPEPK